MFWLQNRNHKQPSMSLCFYLNISQVEMILIITPEGQDTEVGRRGHEYLQISLMKVSSRFSSSWKESPVLELLFSTKTSVLFLTSEFDRNSRSLNWMK